MKRSDRATLARETVRILAAGAYTLPDDGHAVSIRETQEAARAGTRLVLADDPLPSGPGADAARHTTAVQVRECTTLQAAQDHVAAGQRVVALNFASAKNPGGGFLNGARAQEEDLALRTGLYGCIADSPLYELNRAARQPLYLDHVIWSASVPVIRDDAGRLLAEPWPCSVITAPAVNAGYILGQHSDLAPRILPAMQQRAQRVLGTAWAHAGGDVALVLGAWGCGVFRNNPADVAQMFRGLLLDESSPWRGAFAAVTFAVLDPAMCRVFADCMAG